jgi:hypothetical protein
VSAQTVDIVGNPEPHLGAATDPNPQQALWGLRGPLAMIGGPGEAVFHLYAASGNHDAGFGNIWAVGDNLQLGRDRVLCLSERFMGWRAVSGPVRPPGSAGGKEQEQHGAEHNVERFARYLALRLPLPHCLNCVVLPVTREKGAALSFRL